MKGKTKLILSLVLLLLLVSGAGAYYAFRTDPKVAKVLDLGKQMEGMSWEDRGKLRGEMRTAMEELTPQQRDLIREQMFDKGRKEWMAREQKKMSEFFSLSKKDQTKALDKELDDMVKRQKDREKRRQQQANSGGQGNGPNGGGPGGGQGGGGPGGRGGGGGGPGGGTGDRSQDRRLAMDRSSAAQQAQGSEYRRMMADRAAQRGIPIGGGGRRGPW